MWRTIRLMALFFMIYPNIASAADLIIHVDGISEKGVLYVKVAKNDTELKDDTKVFQGFIVPVELGKKFTKKLKVPAGTYAAQAFLDTNDNEVLDTSFFGEPTEPYGFSNNPKIRFRAPSFDKIAFVVEEAQEEPQSIGITLHH